MKRLRSGARFRRRPSERLRFDRATAEVQLMGRTSSLSRAPSAQANLTAGVPPTSMERTRSTTRRRGPQSSQEIHVCRDARSPESLREIVPVSETLGAQNPGGFVRRKKRLEPPWRCRYSRLAQAALASRSGLARQRKFSISIKSVPSVALLVKRKVLRSGLTLRNGASGPSVLVRRRLERVENS